MSEMVERVARAIYEARPIYEERRKVEWDSLLDDEHARFRKVARAAIAAIREPTEGMVERGGQEIEAEYEVSQGVNAVAQDAYRAMIDAALTEGEG